MLGKRRARRVVLRLALLRDVALLQGSQEDCHRLAGARFVREIHAASQASVWSVDYILLLLALRTDSRKEKFTSVLPTCGFSCKRWKIQDFSVYVFDLGGRKGFRGIWPHYFAEAYGAIFVLDSNDKLRFSEAKEELESAVTNTYLIGKPVLVVANKQGPASTMRFEDIRLSLRSLEAAHNLAQCKCDLQERDAALDGDFQEGLQWLLETIQLQYKELRDRVDKDASAQTARESRQRSERRERIKLIKIQSSPQVHLRNPEIRFSKADEQGMESPIEDLLSELSSGKDVVDDFEFHQSTTSLLLPGQIV